MRLVLAVFCVLVLGAAAFSLIDLPIFRNLETFDNVIDAHVHLDYSNELLKVSNIVVSQEEFLKEAKKAGLSGFVFHTTTHSKIPHYEGLHSVACLGIDYIFDVQAMKTKLQSGDFGCIKIYLGYNPRYAYDDAYKPLYKIAGEMNIPVVFHTGDTYRKDALVKYAHPLTIDEVAVAFPETTFVIAHMGNPWFADAAEVAYKNKNVYVDASGILAGDLSKENEYDFQEFLIKPVKWVSSFIYDSQKIMFGSDWPAVDINLYLHAVIRAIPPANRRAFLHDNAVRVFHIKES